MLAAQVRARETELDAQEVNEMLTHGDAAADVRTIDGTGNDNPLLLAHDASPARMTATPSARRVSTRCRCSRNLALPGGLEVGFRSYESAAAAASELAASRRLPRRAASASCASVGFSSLAKKTSRPSDTVPPATLRWNATPAMAKSPCRRASSMNTETQPGLCTGICTSTSSSSGARAVSNRPRK